MSFLPGSAVDSSATAKGYLEHIVVSSSPCDIKRNTRTRIVFDGEWSLSGDDTMSIWYSRQNGCTRFQKVQYWKYRQGVQHELILIPLLDSAGKSTDSFCQIERMADPGFKDRMNAIGVRGTEAYDYVQVFEHNSPKLEYTVLEPEYAVVSEIGFPRTFDLSDILAICYAIQKHPKAKRYTLQQFNCYFFSWTIIVSLARCAAGWEITFHESVNHIREVILNYVKSADSDKQAKLAIILSKIHTPAGDVDAHTMPLPLLDMLTRELEGPSFMSNMGDSIANMLWECRGPDTVKKVLEDHLDNLANNTVELLVGDLGLARDVPLFQQRREALRSVHLHSLEAAKIFHKSAWNMAPKYVTKQKKDMEQMRKDNVTSETTWPLIRRLAASRALLCAGMPLFVAQHSYQGAYLAARADDRIWRHENRSRVFRRVLYATNTVRHLPHHIYYSLKVAIPFTAIAAMKAREQNKTFLELGQQGVSLMIQDLYGELQNMYSPLALEASIAKLRKKNPTWDEYTVRSVIVDVIFELSREIGMSDMSPKDIWRTMLWRCLADMIADAIMKCVIYSPSSKPVEFTWHEPRGKPHESGSEDPPKITSTELQDFIRRRIKCLSKRQVEGAAIAQYIPLPFATPPVESQKEMEDAIENIWRTSRPILGAPST